MKRPIPVATMEIWPPVIWRAALQKILPALVIIVAWLAFKPAGGPDAGLPWDKANHAAAFAVLTVVSALGWPRLTFRRLAVIMLMAGVLIEVIQGLPVVGRDADVQDVVADMTGFVLGWLASAGLRATLGRVRE